MKVALAIDAAAQRGLTNVTFQVANVNGWQDSAAYDFVYCRFLLQHLRRPLDLLRKMWAAVRPGGVLAVEDTDFDGKFCHPPVPRLTSTYATTLRRLGLTAVTR